MFAILLKKSSTKKSFCLIYIVYFLDRIERVAVEDLNVESRVHHGGLKVFIILFGAMENLNIESLVHHGGLEINIYHQLY